MRPLLRSQRCTKARAAGIRETFIRDDVQREVCHRAAEHVKNTPKSGRVLALCAVRLRESRPDWGTGRHTIAPSDPFAATGSPSARAGRTLCHRTRLTRRTSVPGHAQQHGPSGTLRRGASRWKREHVASCVLALVVGGSVLQSCHEAGAEVLQVARVEDKLARTSELLRNRREAPGFDHANFRRAGAPAVLGRSRAG